MSQRSDHWWAVGASFAVVAALVYLPDWQKWFADFARFVQGLIYGR